MSIERQIVDGPAGLFLQDEYFICYVSIYVPCQTSIPYSKNGLMREKYNFFIISSGRYLDNLNNMPTDYIFF